MRNKYDWESIKEEFIKGEMTAGAIAEEHGISWTSVRTHIKNGDWISLRKEYAEAAKDSNISKEIDIADKLLGVLDEAINDEKQFYRYIVKEKNGSDSGEEERIFGKMDMQAFNNAIKALDSLHEIKRVMQGILSPEEERKLQIAESKEKQTDGENSETGIVILPEVEDEK